MVSAQWDDTLTDNHLLPTIMILILAAAMSLLAQPDTVVTTVNRGDSVITVTTIDYGTQKTAKTVDYSSQFNNYKKLAGQNLPAAQYNLAMMYHRGQGTEVNDKEAVKWWKRAAERHHAPSEYMLYQCYSEGIGVKPSDKEAVKWLKAASEDGHSQASLDLARAYIDGKGVKRDTDKAMVNLHDAANKGLDEALYEIALCYAGQPSEAFAVISLPRDMTRAKDMMTRAANNGYKPAAAALARWYTDGTLPADPARAARWKRSAQ